jgi:hypothetical protein
MDRIIKILLATTAGLLGGIVFTANYALAGVFAGMLCLVVIVTCILLHRSMKGKARADRSDDFFLDPMYSGFSGNIWHE